MRRLILIAALLCPSTALAWNRAGHQVIGSIAYRSMTPESRAKVVAILKQHPSFPDWRKAADAVPEADRDEYLFQLAGRWADDIRGKAEFDRPTWHYVNIPLERGKPDGSLPDVEGIVTAYKRNVEGLKGPEKAVAITWLFHLVEDVHQPLHTVKLISDKTPDGDRGGNLFFVRFGEKERTVNLHQVWDGLITGDDKFANCRNIAVDLLKREKPDAAGEFEDWANESYRLARTAAYRDLPVSTDRERGTLLPEGYGKESKAVAETRCLQAGLRLARVLDRIE